MEISTTPFRSSADGWNSTIADEEETLVNQRGRRAIACRCFGSVRNEEYGLRSRDEVADQSKLEFAVQRDR